MSKLIKELTREWKEYKEHVETMNRNRMLGLNDEGVANLKPLQPSFNEFMDYLDYYYNKK